MKGFRSSMRQISLADMLTVKTTPVHSYLHQTSDQYALGFFHKTLLEDEGILCCNSFTCRKETGMST